MRRVKQWRTVMGRPVQPASVPHLPAAVPAAPRACGPMAATAASTRRWNPPSLLLVAARQFTSATSSVTAPPTPPLLDTLLHAPVGADSLAENTDAGVAAVPLAYRRTRIDGAATAPQRIERGAALPALPGAHEAVVLPVVLLHCLLGDGTQFRLLEAQLHKLLAADTAASAAAGSSAPRLVLDLFLPDLRNHGVSPHAREHSYPALVADVRAFIRAHRLHRPLLAGHSQGGKTALAYALSLSEEELSPSSSRSDLVPSGLFLLDAAPAAYTHQHSSIFAAMTHLSSSTVRMEGHAAAEPLLATLRSKREADVALRSMLPSPNDRAFVLTNLVERRTLGAIRRLQHASSPDKHAGEDSSHGHGPDHSSGFAWRCNVDALHRCERLVHGWPLPPPPSLSLSGVGPCFPLPAFFVGGGQSSRLTTAGYTEAIPGYFPLHEMSIIPQAAHFVHHSHAKECASMMLQFVRDKVLPERDASSPASNL